MIGKCKTAGTGDDRMQGELAKLFMSLVKQVCQCFLDICEVTFIICKKQGFILVKNCDFDSGGTNVNSQCVLIHKTEICLLVFVFP